MGGDIKRREPRLHYHVWFDQVVHAISVPVEIALRRHCGDHLFGKRGSGRGEAEVLSVGILGPGNHIQRLDIRGRVSRPWTVQLDSRCGSAAPRGEGTARQ